MKKGIITLLTVSILSLVSCTSKRNNIIVSGYYFGVDSQNSLISCELSINQISKDDFLVADGVNVVEDEINGNFYLLNCLVRLANNEVQKINFLNLKDAYDGAKGAPISYVDDNNYWLTPFTSENNETLPVSECYYSVNIDINDFKLSAYLHFMED